MLKPCTGYKNTLSLRQELTSAGGCFPFLSFFKLILAHLLHHFQTRLIFLRVVIRLLSAAAAILVSWAERDMPTSAPEATLARVYTTRLQQTYLFTALLRTERWLSHQLAITGGPREGFHTKVAHKARGARGGLVSGLRGHMNADAQLENL